jgi:hypothetical protein
MSYDISLRDPETGDQLHTEHPHMLRGGTYAVGGTTQLWLNITYNYAPHYYRLLGKLGIRSLYGRRADETLTDLAAAAAALGRDTHPDYWQPTEGNARLALLDLMQMALLAPHGVWAGD